MNMYKRVQLDSVGTIASYFPRSFLISTLLTPSLTLSFRFKSRQFNYEKENCNE